MKVLKVMILEKLHNKFGYEEEYIWEINKFLKISNRIPKELCSILISELINEGSLIKIEESKYRLKKGIDKQIVKEKNRLKIIRNRTFI